MPNNNIKEESVISRYSEQGDLELIGIHNEARRAIEFYRCEPIKYGEIKEFVLK